MTLENYLTLTLLYRFLCGNLVRMKCAGLYLCVRKGELIGNRRQCWELKLKLKLKLKKV